MQVTENFTFNQNYPARYVKVCHSTHEEGDFSVKTRRKSLLLCQNGWSGRPVLTFARCSYCSWSLTRGIVERALFIIQ